MIESHQVTITGVNSPVMIFKITNSKGYYTELSSYGASVLSIVIPDREGKPGDVVLGYPELENHIEDGPYMGKTVGRFAGRIANGHFRLNNRNYQLEVNNGKNHLHGGSHGLAFRNWNTKIIDDLTVCFSTTAKSKEDGYPGDADLSVTYTWTEDNTLSISYQGIPTEDTILNLTNHTYFNLSGEPTILQHQLKLYADRYLPIDTESIPTGRIEPVDGTPMDFRKFAVIGKKMDCSHPQLSIDRGYNQCWVISPREPEKLPAVEIHCPENGRILRIFSDYPGAVIYCGNYFDGSIQDKHHLPLKAYAGIAVEMQYYPDCPNLQQVPSCFIKKGEIYKHKIKYCFEII